MCGKSADPKKYCTNNSMNVRARESETKRLQRSSHSMVWEFGNGVNSDAQGETELLER